MLGVIQNMYFFYFWTSQGYYKKWKKVHCCITVEKKITELHDRGQMSNLQVVMIYIKIIIKS